MHVEAAFGDRSALLVGYRALPYPTARREVPGRPGEIKLIFSSTVMKESSCARLLAKAMPIAVSALSQRIPPCRVPMGFACAVPLPGRPSPVRHNVLRLKSNQTRDRHVVRFCSFPKVRLRGKVLITHDLSALAFDFRARTSVSRYSSR
jgi:hypothetical protein